MGFVKALQRLSTSKAGKQQGRQQVSKQQLARRGGRAISQVLESLEDRRLMAAGWAYSFTLLDGDTGRDIMTVHNGAAINRQAIGAQNLLLRANVGGDPGSVQLTLDGATTIDNAAAFTVPLAWDAGTHTLSATPTGEDNGAGPAGSSHTVTFSTVNVTSTPFAPASLVAAAPAYNRVDLTWWDLSGNEAGFRVMRSANGGAWQQVGAAAVNATGFTDTTAAGGVGYAYQVQAFNGVGGSNTTNTARVTTPSAPTNTPPPPTSSLATPANVAAAFVNATDVKVTWADTSTGESGFKIFRSTDGMNFKGIQTVGANSTSYTDRGLTAGQKYYYRVGAYTSTQESDWSAIAATDGGGSTTPTNPPPAAVVARPTNLAGTALSQGEVSLTWTDTSTGEEGFKLFRSASGVNYTAFRTVGANVTSFKDTGLAAGTKYYYRVLAYGSGSESDWSDAAEVTTMPSTAPAPDPTPTPNPTPNPTPIPSTLGMLNPSQADVDKAIAHPLIRYNRWILGGAHTNQPNGGGAPEVLATAAFFGNTTADGRLLQQIRYTLTGGNDPTSTGGYTAQHEHHMTVAFAMVKRTPRVWNALTDAERNKVNLLMTASVVASAFTTSDNNPFIRAGTQQYTIDGDSNIGREWNPNYRQGMLGNMLAAVAYFGSPAAVDMVLAAYSHSTFLVQLRNAGLTNTYESFNWKNANPSSGAPTGTQIQDAVRTYRYHGRPISDYMGIYGELADITFSKYVNAGLNGGLGVDGAGRILNGADALPNRGALGMLMEFDAYDAVSLRSSATYAYDGWRTHLANHHLLLITGLWKNDSPVATKYLPRMAIGSTDLWYKLQMGYANYARGYHRGDVDLNTPDRGYEFTRPVWNAVKAFHNL